MKTAYLIIGPESSGTRFTTSLFIKAGCNGDDTHEQRWDIEQPTGDKIVWRRSYLHAASILFPFIQDISGIPDFEAMLQHIEGYTPQIIVCNRDWFCVYQSCKLKGYTYTYEHFLGVTQQKYARIITFAAAKEIPFHMFHYEAALLSGMTYINQFLHQCGLPSIADVTIKDANNQYYNSSTYLQTR